MDTEIIMTWLYQNIFKSYLINDCLILLLDYDFYYS
jgi:hypothetical protein